MDDKILKMIDQAERAAFVKRMNKKYWTEVIDMSEYYNIDPWKLVKLTFIPEDKIYLLNDHPAFSSLIESDWKIEFAVGVVNYISVFPDDILYARSTGDKLRAIRKDDQDAIIVCESLKYEDRNEYYVNVSNLQWSNPNDLTNTEIDIIIDAMYNVPSYVVSQDRNDRIIRKLRARKD